MEGEHKLTKQDEWFIRLGKKDPVTGKTFELGDVIVICDTCKSPHLRDTWLMMGYCSVMPSHKSVAMTFHPDMFRRTAQTKGFKIRDTLNLTFMEKLKRFNWFPLCLSVAVLTMALFIVTALFVDENKSDLVTNLNDIMLEAKGKLAPIKMKTSDAFSINKTNIVALSSDRLEKIKTTIIQSDFAFKISKAKVGLRELWSMGMENMRFVFARIKSFIMEQGW